MTTRFRQYAARLKPDHGGVERYPRRPPIHYQEVSALFQERVPLPSTRVHIIAIDRRTRDSERSQHEYTTTHRG